MSKGDCDINMLMVSSICFFQILNIGRFPNIFSNFWKTKFKFSNIPKDWKKQMHEAHISLIWYVSWFWGILAPQPDDVIVKSPPPCLQSSVQCKSLTPYLLRKISPFCCICLAKQRWSLWGICLLCRMFRFKPLFIYPLHPVARRTVWARSTSNPRFVETGAGSLFHYHSLFLEQVEKSKFII